MDSTLRRDPSLKLMDTLHQICSLVVSWQFCMYRDAHRGYTLDTETSAPAIGRAVTWLTCTIVANQPVRTPSRTIMRVLILPAPFWLLFLLARKIDVRPPGNPVPTTTSYSEPQRHSGPESHTSAPLFMTFVHSTQTHTACEAHSRTRCLTLPCHRPFLAFAQTGKERQMS